MICKSNSWLVLHGDSWLGAISAYNSTAAAAPANSQINLVLLAEALRSASTFHDLVKNLNVEKNLNPGPNAAPLDRTVAIMGAGAGAGAAIGEMSHSPEGHPDRCRRRRRGRVPG